MKKLGLFFTYGTSLENWHNNGSLDREINIYTKFFDCFDEIYFFTYGKNDKEYEKFLPDKIRIFPKKLNIPNFVYSIIFPILYKEEIKEVSWIKTNQMLGSWSAVISKIVFQKKLNIRTGYVESLTYLNKNFFDKIIIDIIEFVAYKFADIATVTTQYHKDYIFKRYKTKNIKIIPNGIDTKIFKPNPNKTQTEKIRFLFVGRLNPEKNISNLLKSMKDLKNIRLKIIGQGQLKKKVLELKEKYNLDLEIVDRISNNELPNEYNNCDVYIQPSIYEGNPKTILEAMSCGLPVIASNVKGINNLIVHEENGYLCQIESESIRKTITEVLENPQLAEKSGKKAREFIEKNYNLENMIKKEIEIYK